MPELPDLTVYREHLERRIAGATLTGLRIAHPFLLRSVDPSPDALVGRKAGETRLIGKRLVFGFDDELYAVLHLMIAGRLRWSEQRQTIPRKRGLARFDFSSGSLLLTEEGTKRRASLTVVRGEEALSALDPGGLRVFDIDCETFAAVIRRENHTLKRTLTDPRLFSGIGNSYSDEILHRARLSPFKQSRSLSDSEIEKLYRAAGDTLAEWTDRLRRETGDRFPARVTAFHPDMAVHGRYEKPCPVCGTPIQRIRYAEHESNYCPRCQTEGRLLADRALSRLLKEDWPKTVEELEAVRKPS